MNNTYGVFKREVARNPYPARWRLPGHQTKIGRPIDGIARQGIVHALTYYGIPKDIDALIDELPDEKRLAALLPPAKKYFSFTVYSLKQMVAAGTISPETAWSLLFGEWGNINQVGPDNFRERRQAFWRRSWHCLREEFGIKRMDDLRRRCFDDARRGIDLLAFKFFASAGPAGLAQYECFRSWAQAVKSNLDPLNPILGECLEAVWVEARIIEDQVGISGLNKNITTFTWDRAGDADYDELGLKARIDLLVPPKAKKPDSPLDSGIKAETGHWLFEQLNFVPKWLSELMDRMNMSGFTERVKEAFVLHPHPEAYVFKGGAFLLSMCQEDYPVYPLDNGFEWRNRCRSEKHTIAEYVELRIRERLIRAIEERELELQDLYRAYRRMGLYIALLVLEWRAAGVPKGSGPDYYGRAIDEIEKLHLAKVNEYCDNYLERAIASLETLLKRKKDPNLCARVARNLVYLQALAPDSSEARQLQAYSLLAERDWSKLAALGVDAQPALFSLFEKGKVSYWAQGIRVLETVKPGLAEKILEEQVYNNPDPGIRGKAAKWLIKYKDLPSVSAERTSLYAFQLVAQFDGKGLAMFNNQECFDAVQALFRHGNYIHWQYLAEHLLSAGSPEARKIFNRGLRYKADPRVRQAAREALRRFTKAKAR